MVKNGSKILRLHRRIHAAVGIAHFEVNVSADPRTNEAWTVLDTQAGQAVSLGGGYSHSATETPNQIKKLNCSGTISALIVSYSASMTRDKARTLRREPLQ